MSPGILRARRPIHRVGAGVAQAAGLAVGGVAALDRQVARVGMDQGTPGIGAGYPIIALLTRERDRRAFADRRHGADRPCGVVIAHRLAPDFWVAGWRDEVGAAARRGRTCACAASDATGTARMIGATEWVPTGRVAAADHGEWVGMTCFSTINALLKYRYWKARPTRGSITLKTRSGA
jgi:hypothetical protein